MSDHQEAFEAAAAAGATKAMYGGAGAASAGFVVSNQVLGVLGLLIALAGFVVNAYYRRRQNQREERQDQREELEHQRRMRMIVTQPGKLDEAKP